MNRQGKIKILGFAFLSILLFGFSCPAKAADCIWESACESSHPGKVMGDGTSSCGASKPENTFCCCALPSAVPSSGPADSQPFCNWREPSNGNACGTIGGEQPYGQNSFCPHASPSVKPDATATCCCPSTVITAPTPTPAAVLNNPFDNLNVKIPGLYQNIGCKKNNDGSYTCPKVNCDSNVDGSATCVIPWIGQYIIAIFNYSLIIIGLLSAVTIMGGGVLWLISGTNASRMKTAKEMIIGSLSGLIIMFATYMIVSIVNPDILIFRPLVIGYIKYEDANWDTVKTSNQSPPKYCGCVSWKYLWATSKLNNGPAIKAKLGISPLAPYSDLVAQLSTKNHLDAALALAIWKVDSSYGQAGAGKTNNNPGNVICGGASSGTGWTCNGRFRQYTDFGAAVNDWFAIMSRPNSRLNKSKTIRELIKTYCPPDDKDDTQAYINMVMSSLDSAQGGTLKATDGDPDSLKNCADISSGCK